METLDIQRLSEYSSAEAEITFLQAVADSIPEGSWLSFLFTENLIGWVTAQVKGEASPDIFSAYDVANTKIATQEDEISRLRESRCAAISGWTKSQAEISRLRAAQEKIDNKATDDWQARYSELHKAWADTREDFETLVERLHNLACGAWLADQKLEPEEIRDLLNAK